MNAVKENAEELEKITAARRNELQHQKMPSCFGALELKGGWAGVEKEGSVWIVSLDFYLCQSSLSPKSPLFAPHSRGTHSHWGDGVPVVSSHLLHDKKCPALSIWDPGYYAMCMKTTPLLGPIRAKEGKKLHNDKKKEKKEAVNPFWARGKHYFYWHFFPPEIRFVSGWFYFSWRGIIIIYWLPAVVVLQGTMSHLPSSVCI